VQKWVCIVLMGVALFLGQPLRAQKEGAVWHFGNKAGLDFKNSYPLPVAGGKTRFAEGVASISDQNGNLLFYTDGQTVYNRNHEIMSTESLSGSPSGTQSSIILPKPGSGHLYYIITVDKAVSALTPNYKGLTYSLVDMNQNNSMGAVLLPCNIPMPGSASTLFTEKITAAKRNDGNYWIIAHQFGTWAFYEYLLTDQGISLESTPTAGSEYHLDPADPANTNATGYLKFSPDGNYLVAAIQGMKIFELFKFYKSSGAIQQIATLSAGNTQNPVAQTGAAYGIEFSPTGKYLYGSSKTDGILYQWDISLPTEAEIKASAKILWDDPNVPCGALQLAKNGKIYVAFDGKPYLGVIRSPDFDSCDFLLRGASLISADGFEGISRFGLPNIPANFFSDTICYTHDCLNDTTLLYLASEDLVDEAPNWFVDNISITDAGPTFTPTYVFPHAGEYEITMVGSKNGVRTVFKRTIRIHPRPEFTVKDSTTYLCDNQSIVLHDGKYPFFGITDGSGVYTDGLRIIETPGIYRVTATNYEGCTTELKTRAIDVQKPKIDTIMVTPAICNGIDNGSIRIYLKEPRLPYKFEWADEPTDTPVRENLKPGSYSVIISIIGGCEPIDTTLTIESRKIDLKLTRSPEDTGKICAGDTITLTASGADSYGWAHDLSITTNQIKVTPDTTTIYKVTGSIGGACSTADSIEIKVYPDYRLNMGGDLTPCLGELVDLNIRDFEFGEKYTEFLWWNSSTNVTLQVIDDKKDLWLRVKDENGCFSYDSIDVAFQPAITVDLQRSPATPDVICPGDAITLTASGATYFEWEHQPGVIQNSVVVYPDHDTVYTVTGTNGGTCKVSQSITIRVRKISKLNLGPDRHACPGDTITLRPSEYDPGSIYSEWHWSTGETTDSLVIFQSMQGLALTVKDPGGCLTTDTIGIFFDPLPLFSTTQKDNSCFNSNDGSVEIMAGNDPTLFSYSINSGVWTNNPVFGNLPAGDYAFRVKLKEAPGCVSLPDTITITRPEPLAHQVTAMNPSCPECTNGEIRIHVTGGTPDYSFDWAGYNFHDSVFTHIAANTYTIFITDKLGCRDTVVYALTAGEMFIPNAFSPNGGTKNEKWMIRILDYRTNCLVQVYDRSGKLVFHNEGVYDPWDGTYRNEGKKLPAGTYFYQVVIDRDDSTIPIRKGTITILR